MVGGLYYVFRKFLRVVMGLFVIRVLLIRMMLVLVEW